MRLVLIFSALILSYDALSQIRPFQTARLNSTSGAGIGSILVIESATLNPAPLAFFNDTFVSYQKTAVDLKSESDERTNNQREFPDTNRHEGYFLFDNGSAVKGGFSYQTQREGGFQRKRGTASLASAISDNMALGILYKYTQDYRPGWYASHHKVSHPITLGYTWIVMPTFIVGATWDDPGRAIKGESRASAGVQYNITDKFIFIADAGGDPTIDYYDSRLWRAALQFNVFADFFARAGKFQDRSLNLEGNSWGLSWTGPKLGADFAIKNSRQIEKRIDYLYPDESITEVSFALNVRF